MQTNYLSKIVSAISATLMLSACGAGTESSLSLPTSSGSERLTWASEPIELDRTNSTYSAPSSGGISASAVTVSLNLNLVATLAPPNINGVGAYATDVIMSGTKAYVSYNTPGLGYGGGVDVIETLVPTLPVLSSSLADGTTDFSQLLVYANTLYAAGAKDTLLADSAIVNRYPLTLAGNLTGAAPTTQVIPGYTGLGVASDGLNLYAVSGNNGGLSIMNMSTLAVSTSVALEGARDLKIRAGKVAVLAAKTASSNPLVKSYSMAGVAASTSGTMPNSVIDEAKSTLTSGVLFDMATAGEGGVNLICQATGTVMNTIANPVVAGLTTAQTAANAAAFSGGLVFVANGGAGIYVYALERQHLLDDCSVNVQYVGRFTFPDGLSINNVMIANGYLIAATGAGGFKIVQITQGVTVGVLGAL